MYYRRRRETYLPFNLDLQVHVLYAAAALFGSFLVITLVFGLLAHDYLGWPFIRSAVFGFLCIWLAASVLLAVFRRSPLVLTSGFLALAITAYLGLAYFPEAFYVEDILATLPILVLWTLMYYFYELFRKGGSWRFLPLALSLLSLAGLILFIVFLIHPVGEEGALTISISDSIERRYRDLVAKGSHAFEVYGVGRGRRFQGKLLEVPDLLPQGLEGLSDPVKPAGSIYLPQEGDVPYPVVFISLNTYSYNYRDFTYLAEHLAAKGFLVVISPLYVREGFSRSEDARWQRGLLILDYLQKLAETPMPKTGEDGEDEFGGTLPIDLQNVVLISFGDAADAAASACYILQEGIYPPNRNVSVPEGVSIKGFLAIAPYNQNFELRLRNVNYVAVAGGNDSYANLSMDPLYNNLALDEKTSHIKSHIYLQDANHSHFIKSVPGMNFPGFLLFRRDEVLKPSAQKEALVAVATAAVRYSLGETNLGPFFTNGDLRKIYPDLRFQARTQVAGEVLITDFESGLGLNSFISNGAGLTLEGYKDYAIEKTGRNQTLRVEAEEETYLLLDLPVAFSKNANLHSQSTFAFSLAVQDENLEDVFVEIENRRGQSQRISLKDLKDLPRSRESRPYKLELMNQQVEDKVYFETFSVPLYLFFSERDYYPWQELTRVKLTFVPKEGTAAVFLVDDIVFRSL